MDSWVWDLIGIAAAVALVFGGLAAISWADRKPAPHTVVNENNSSSHWDTKNYYNTLERMRSEVAAAADKLDNRAVAPQSALDQIKQGPVPTLPPKPIEIPRDASAIKPRAKRAYTKRAPAKPKHR